MANDNQINIFLSSTFDQHMLDNRDFFRNEIMARLNQVFGEVGYKAYVYDLVLGVPDKTDPYDTVKTCYDYIIKSDYFLCIIGFNYGTLMDEFIADTLSAHQNYREEINEFKEKGLSITASEIAIAERAFAIRKKLKIPKDKKIVKAFFIHKDIAELSDSHVALLTGTIDQWLAGAEFETYGEDLYEFIIKSTENMEGFSRKVLLQFSKAIIDKNNSLQEKKNDKVVLELIRTNILRTFQGKQIILDQEKHYEYADRSQLANHVEDFFNQQLTKGGFRFCPNNSLEEKTNNLIVSQKTRYYVSPEDTINDLKNYVYGNEQKVLVLTGEKGSGKSAVLGELGRELKQDGNWLVISVFAGTGLSSAYHILQYIYFRLFGVKEINDLFLNPRENLEEAMLQEFQSIIQYRAPKNDKVVIIIDGLDNIKYIDNNTGLNWLPVGLPPNIKLIVSTSKNLESKDLKRINMKPTPLKDIIRYAFDMEGKSLEPEIEKYIKKIDETLLDNYYSIALCREIMTEFDYKSIKKLEEQFANISTYEDIVIRYLSRLRKRYLKDGKDIVKEILLLLYFTKNSLPMSGLEMIFGESYQRQVKDFLYQMYFDMTIDSNKNISITNQDYKSCIARLFLDDNQFEEQTPLTELGDVPGLGGNVEKAYRGKIVELLMHGGDYPEDEFQLDEITYQLYMLGDEKRLFQALCDIKRVVWLSENTALLIRYLHALEKYLHNIFIDWEQQAKLKHTDFIGRIYYHMGFPQKARDYYLKLIERKKIKMKKLLKNLDLYPSILTKRDVIMAASLFCNLALAYKDMESKKAEKYAAEALEAVRHVLGTRNIHTLKMMLILAEVQRNNSRALEICEECIYNMEPTLPKDHAFLFNAYLLEAELLNNVTKTSKASEYLEKANSVMIANFEAESRQAAQYYYQRGILYKNLMQFDNAKREFESSYEILKKIYGGYNRMTLNLLENLKVVTDQYKNPGKYQEYCMEEETIKKNLKI